MSLLVGDATEYGTGTDSSLAQNAAEVYKYTAAESGLVTQLSFWARGLCDYTTIDLLIYADDGGAPGALLDVGSAPNPSVADDASAWVDATVHVLVVGGTTYWLGFQPRGGDAYYNQSASVSALAWDSTGTSGTPFDPFPTSRDTFNGWNVGLRALGEPGAAPPGFEFFVTGLWYPAAETVTEYGQIVDPQSGSVTIPLNDSRLAEVTVSMYDPIVADLVHHAYARALKVYYYGTLVFWGPVKLNNPKFGDGTITINAVDPSIRAIRHYLRRGDIGGSLSAVNDDKATVTIDGAGLRLLLDAARNIPGQTARGCPDIGIDIGTDEATAAPDALMGIARGDDVWDAIVQLSQSLGPDFDLAPRDDLLGSYCELNTFDRQGSDLSGSVQLHYGTGLDNLDGLEFTEGSEYVTHAHVLSRDGRRVSAVDVEASAETGQYTAWDATDFDAAHIDPAKADAVLGQYGEAIIHAYGRPLIVLTLTMPLDTANGYQYGRDYAVGDTIDVAGEKGYVTLEEAAYRITQVKLNQDGAGTRPEIQVVSDRTVGDTIDNSGGEG